MRSVLDGVLLFCSEVKAGGPEALHQAGYQIARHGGSARRSIACAPHSRIAVDGDILRCHAEASPMPAHFAQYQPQVLRETRLGTMTLVVFPEPLSRMRSGMRDSVWLCASCQSAPPSPLNAMTRAEPCVYLANELGHYCSRKDPDGRYRAVCAAYEAPPDAASAISLIAMWTYRWWIRSKC